MSGQKDIRELADQVLKHVQEIREDDLGMDELFDKATAAMKAFQAFEKRYASAGFDVKLLRVGSTGKGAEEAFDWQALET